MIPLLRRLRPAPALIALSALLIAGQAHAGAFEEFFRAVRQDDAAEVQQLLDRGFDANTSDEKGRSALVIALQEPSPAVVRALTAWPRIDPNRLSDKGESPLMLAAIKGQTDLVRALIDKGADVNKAGWTPLHYAASSSNPNSVAIIGLLLEHHAYIDAESPNRSTPLMMAAMYGSVQSVRLLLSEGADATLKNQQGLTALQFAERAKRPEVAEIIRKALPGRAAPGQW